jgi:hypothetical protein
MNSITGTAALNIARHHKASTDPAIREEAEFMEPVIVKAMERYAKRKERLSKKPRNGSGGTN